ncbi:SRPBCC family protein [Actinokineospora sp.]|uniref:SRPBCC family protein n=1 Tax=Actinokineospora sp. TaxID=1872133 RepID=UPI00403760B3
MQLEHRFSVPAGIDTVWAAVLDPERVAPCMPGATLTAVDGDSFTGNVKVKLGPISLLYKGSGEFLAKDEAARRVVIKAAGKDSRGNGTASATVTLTLVADGADATTGEVVTDLAITGKPAQFGRGLIVEVGGKILDAFAGCLATKLGGPAEDAAPAPPVDAKKADTKAQPEPDRPLHAVPEEPKVPRAAAAEPASAPIDLMEFAGPSLVKRALPLAVGAVLILVFLMIRRRH